MKKKYKISGIWKNDEGVITHYAFHEVSEKGVCIGKKVSKETAIALLEAGNTAVTRIWDYKSASFKNGEDVEVVNSKNGKYLRSNPDNTLTDNLLHLIDYDWLRGIAA